MTSVAYEPFFTEESYRKYSVFPSFLDLIKQKDVEINGPLVSRNDSSQAKKQGAEQRGPSAQWKDIIYQSKKKPEKPKVPYLYPAVAFPRLSWLTKDDQKKFLELLEKYGSPGRPVGHTGEHKELLLLRDLQARVLTEQAEYIKYLQNAAYKLHKDYLHISDGADSYISEMLGCRSKRMVSYPQFYVQHDSVSVRTPRVVRDVAFFHIKTLLNLGTVPEFVPVIGGQKALKNNLCCDMKHLRKSIPADSSRTSNKKVCSEDRTAEQLAVKHRVQVVISSSALNCLVDNHEPYHRQWEIPVVVRELHEKLDSGQINTYKVVFIDKPFVQKQMTVREWNQAFQKVSVKYAYTHPTQAGSFMKVPEPNGNDIEFKYTEDDKHQRHCSDSKSYSAETFIDEDLQDSSADMDDLETFGTGPSKRPKLSVTGEILTKNEAVLKSPVLKIENVPEDSEKKLETGENQSKPVESSCSGQSEGIAVVKEVNDIETDLSKENLKVAITPAETERLTPVGDIQEMEGEQCDTASETKGGDLEKGVSADLTRSSESDVGIGDEHRKTKADGTSKALTEKTVLSLGSSTCSESESDALVIEMDNDAALEIDLSQSDGCVDEHAELPQYDGPSDIKRTRGRKALSKNKSVRKVGLVKKKVKQVGRSVTKQKGGQGMRKKGSGKVAKRKLSKEGTTEEDTTQTLAVSEQGMTLKAKTRKILPSRTIGLKRIAERRHGLKVLKVSLTAEKSLKLKQRQKAYTVGSKVQRDAVKAHIAAKVEDVKETGLKEEHVEVKEKAGRCIGVRRQRRRSRASAEGTITEEVEETGGLSEQGMGKSGSCKNDQRRRKSMVEKLGYEENRGPRRSSKGRRRSVVVEKGKLSLDSDEARQDKEILATEVCESGVDTDSDGLVIDDSSAVGIDNSLSEDVNVKPSVVEGGCTAYGERQGRVRSELCAANLNTDNTVIKEEQFDTVAPPVRKKRGRPPKKSLDHRRSMETEAGCQRDSIVTRKSISLVDKSESDTVTIKQEVQANEWNEKDVGVTGCGSVAEARGALPVQKRGRGRPRKNREDQNAVVVKTENVSVPEENNSETDLGTPQGDKRNAYKDTEPTSLPRMTRTRRSVTSCVLDLNDPHVSKEAGGDVSQTELEDHGVGRKVKARKSVQRLSSSGDTMVTRKRGRPPLKRSVSEIVTPQIASESRSTGQLLRRTTRSSSARSSSKQGKGPETTSTQKTKPGAVQEIEGMENGAGVKSEESCDLDTEAELVIDDVDKVAGAQLEELQEDLDLSGSEESVSGEEAILSPGGGSKKSRRLYFSDEDSEEEERRRAQKAQKKWIDSVRQPVKLSQSGRRSSDPKPGELNEGAEVDSTETVKKPAIKVKSGTKKLFEDMDNIPTNKPARKTLPTIRRKPQTLPKYKPQNAAETDTSIVMECLPETKSKGFVNATKKLPKQKHVMASESSINLQLKQRIMRRRQISSKLGQKASETTRMESETTGKKSKTGITVEIPQFTPEIEPVSFASAPESPKEHFKNQNPPLSPTPERASSLTPSTLIEKLKGPKVIPLEKVRDVHESNTETVEDIDKCDQEISGITQLKLGFPSGITPLGKNQDSSYSRHPSEGSVPGDSYTATVDHSLEDTTEFGETSVPVSAGHPPVIQRRLPVNKVGQTRTRSSDYKSNIGSDGLMVPTQRKARVSLVTEGTVLHRDTTKRETSSHVCPVSGIKPSKAKENKPKTWVKAKESESSGVGILDRLIPVKHTGSAGQTRVQGQKGTSLDSSPQVGGKSVVDGQQETSLNQSHVLSVNQNVHQGIGLDQSHTPRTDIQQGTMQDESQVHERPVDAHTLVCSSVQPQGWLVHPVVKDTSSVKSEGRNATPQSGLPQENRTGHYPGRVQNQQYPAVCRESVKQYPTSEVRDYLTSPPREVPTFVHPHPFPMTPTHLYQAPSHIRDPKEWEMYEDPKGFESPHNSNLMYNLWQLGRFKVLIRCKVHAAKPQVSKNSKVNFLHFQPKLEYQRYHGYEQHTLSEISRSWINLAIRPRCNLYRVRIASKNSEVLSEEEVDLAQVLGSSANFSPKASLDILEGVFDKLCSLHPGHYLLGHARGNSQAHIKKTTQSHTGSYNLHTAYNNLKVDTETVPWIPVDPSINLPFHLHYHRVPCTFEPKDTEKPFFRRDQDDKKFKHKGKKNKKKTKTTTTKK